MRPFIEARLFPDDMQKVLVFYMENPAASSCTDLNLFRKLKEYDTPDHKTRTIDQLPEEALFMLKNGRVFQKKEKLRKRYRCIEVKTQRVYLFNPMAEVTPYWNEDGERKN